MARQNGPFSTDNPWRVIGISIAAGLTVGVGLFGFILLPLADRDAGVSLWNAICTSIGLPRSIRTAAPPPPRYASTVRWTPEAISATRSGDAGRGASLAETCGACHGSKGISGQDWIPSLAGMRAEAMVKQLVDFRTGHRRWGVMNAIAQSMSQHDMEDAAALYAALPPPKADDFALTSLVASPLRAGNPIERLVFAGDPLRGIAPCASCHGLGGIKRGAPVLAGQHPAYLERQLDGFNRQVRHNDEGEQMRVIATSLTPSEMHEVAGFLSVHAPEP